MQKITLSQNGETLHLKNNDSFELELPENPTTGYRWSIKKADPSQITVTDCENKPAGSAMGAGGLRIFLIKVIGQGKSELVLSHENSWEEDSLDTFRLFLES